MPGWQHTLLQVEKGPNITPQINSNNPISILKKGSKELITQRKKLFKTLKTKNPKLIWVWIWAGERECTSAGSRIGSQNDTVFVSNADDSGSHGMGSAEIDFLIHDSTAKQQEEEERKSENVESALIKHKKKSRKQVLLYIFFFRLVA